MNFISRPSTYFFRKFSINNIYFFRFSSIQFKRFWNEEKDLQYKHEKELHSGMEPYLSDKNHWLSSNNFKTINKEIAQFQNLKVVRDIALNLNKLNINDNQIWNNIMTAILNNKNSFSSLEIKYSINLLSSISKISYKDEKTKKKILEVNQLLITLISTKLKNIPAPYKEDIIQTIMASAKSKVYNDDLRNSTLNFLKTSHNMLNDNDIARLLWALGKISHDSSKAIKDEYIDKEIRKYFRTENSAYLFKYIKIEMSELNFVHIFQAIMRLEIREKDLIVEFCRVSNILLKKISNYSFSAAINSIQENIEQFNPLKTIIKNEINRRLYSLEIPQFFGILRGISHSNFIDYEEILLFSKKYLITNIDLFIDDEVATLMFCFAQVKSKDDEIISNLLSRIPKMEKRSINSSSLILWSLAVLNKLSLNPKITSLLMNQILSHDFTYGKEIMSKTQINQVLISFNFFEDKNNFPEIDFEKMKQLYQSILSEKFDFHKQNFKFNNKGSKNSFDIIKAISIMNLNPIPELFFNNYTVDLTLLNINENTFKECRNLIQNMDITKFEELWKNWEFKHEKEFDLQKLTSSTDDKLLIEINGPYHYLGDSNKIKGATLLKQRHFDEFGYRHVSFTQMECYNLSIGFGKEKMSLFLDKLENAYNIKKKH